jgi:hypothetical protein
MVRDIDVLGAYGARDAAAGGLEHSEELIGITGVEAHSMIPHKVNCSVVGFVRTDFNYSGLARSRDFSRIGTKIREI